MVRALFVLAMTVVSAALAPEAGAAAELCVNKDSIQAADNCATHGTAAKPLRTVANAADTCAPAKADDVVPLRLPGLSRSPAPNASVAAQMRQALSQQASRALRALVLK
jgi:hypothetical protein